MRTNKRYGRKRKVQGRLHKGLYEAYVNSENSLLNQLKRKLETLTNEQEIHLVNLQIANLTA